MGNGISDAARLDAMLAAMRRAEGSITRDALIAEFAARGLAGFAMKAFQDPTIYRKGFAAGCWLGDGLMFLENENESLMKVLNRARVTGVKRTFIIRLPDGSFLPFPAPTPGCIADTEWKLVPAAPCPAADRINAVLNRTETPPALWAQLFPIAPGWKVPVVIDTETTLQTRRTEYQNGGNDGTVTDLLGAYRYAAHWEADGKFPAMNTGTIILYLRAIGEFRAELGEDLCSFDELILYVLAHELFHALQDLTAGTLYLRQEGCAHAQKDVLEPQAEYFALRTVLRICGNQALFNALCDFRRNDNSIYTAAVDRFGDAANGASEQTFTEQFAVWRAAIADAYAQLLKGGTV